MIAVDTNILVRFLTQDDKEQFIKVEHLFRQHAGDGEIFIAMLVILEMNWVLTSLYDWEPSRFYDAVEDILSCLSFLVENDVKVRNAVAACRANSKLDFSDALIGYAGAHRGLTTYTFDKKLRGTSIFHVL
jgi:predicted nucleic-acid-binding protein